MTNPDLRKSSASRSKSSLFLGQTGEPVYLEQGRKESKQQRFHFYNPVQTTFGEDIYLQTLSRIFGATAQRLGLFYGKRAMKNAGAIERIKVCMPGCDFIEVGGIAPNPELRDLEKMLTSLSPIDGIIGIGGGSVLDTAKIASLLANRRESLTECLKDGSRQSSWHTLPLVAIPTTSGSGSEVTPWATVWDKPMGKKYSLSSTNMYPSHAIVDPALTVNLPRSETASSAFDALSHAFEALWSIHSNPISDLYAIEAIRIIIEYLPLACKDLADLHYRAQLAKTSMLAGLAFSNTKTAAVHAVSYPMTLRYDVPHGVACSLTLAEFWLFNCPAMNREKVQRLLNSLELAGPKELYLTLKELAWEVGLPTSLRAAGVPANGKETIVKEGFHPDRMNQNPRTVTPESLRTLLNRIAD
ncbi:iron-containing alcohol dehydrogenase [bacterium]|nr:iron-containing alcohol dehydrogenase [bacterium]